jgi:hypothetical protein
MRSSTFSYILSGLSLFAAIISALCHDFRFLLLNFFFAVFNYYVAGWKRRIEDEDPRDSETKE